MEIHNYFKRIKNNTLFLHLKNKIQEFEQLVATQKMSCTIYIFFLLVGGRKEQGVTEFIEFSKEGRA